MAAEKTLEQLAQEVKTAQEAMPCHLSDYWLERVSTATAFILVSDEEDIDREIVEFLINKIRAYQQEQGIVIDEAGLREDPLKLIADYATEVMAELFNRSHTEEYCELKTLETIFDDDPVKVKFVLRKDGNTERLPAKG